MSEYLCIGEKAGVYKCLIYYDCKLCETIEYFAELTVKIIEFQAYNSYMDGAR